jgi:hypothetical protein
LFINTAVDYFKTNEADLERNQQKGWPTYVESGKQRKTIWFGKKEGKADKL